MALAVRLVAFLFLLLGLILLERTLRGNSVLLMLLLSLITPMPAVESVSYLLDRVSPKLLLVLRIIGVQWKIITAAFQALFSPVCAVLQFVLFHWLEECCWFIVKIARKSNAVLLHLVWCLSITPPLLLRLTTVLVGAVFAPPAICLCSLKQLLCIIFPRLGGFLDHMQNIVLYSLVCYCQTYGCRLLSDLSISLVFLAVIFPGSSIVANYLVTGHLYAGSIVKIWPCKLEPAVGSASCTFIYYFLEFSYSVINVLRTVVLYRCSSCVHQMSWDTAKLICLLKTSSDLWLPHLRLLIVGVTIPFMVDYFCPLHIFSNTVCVMSNLAFLVILNSQTAGGMALYYCGTCMIGVHILNVVVTAVSVCNTLWLTADSFVTQVWSAVALCLTVHISISTCTRIVRKLLWSANDTPVRVNDEST